MKKIILSTFAVLCVLGMSACSSSSSSGSSNNKVDKQDYEILKSEVTDLNSTLSDLQTTLQRLQNRLASSQSASKSEIEKLEAQLAEAKGNEAKTAELVQQLDEQLKNAIKAATESGDARLAEALAKSQEEVAAIKKQADDAAKKANDAINNAQKAQEDLNKAKADLEEAKSRAPISDKIFGGASGKMTAASGKLSGGVLVKDKDGTVSSIDAPDTREGISYITVIDDRGNAVDVGIDSAHGGWKRNLGGSSLFDHSGAIVRYGVYNSSETEKGYIYSQGQATEIDKMPREGEFTYLGTVGQASYQYGSWSADSGSAYAKVNFADKTARVELNTEFAAAQNGRTASTRVEAYTFDSKITENSISGVANENKEVKMQAGFFGDDAKYLSGIYQSDKVQGVFGVTKQ
ncbi:transferrin-binding protein-like solute binding protein [Mannheimia indoligenes]|uniref:transferrin-binding protein-like solute binding protein n=1 Tax=Mannheimia indoligenes TaxID=3103145 RepID=UPI002FE68089